MKFAGSSTITGISLLRALWITLTTLSLLAQAASGQECLGVAHSCESVRAPVGCIEGTITGTDTVVDTCQFCFVCDIQGGCGCSTTEVSCDFGICNALVNCVGPPTECSSYTTDFTCLRQSGCYWSPDTATLEFDAGEEVGICQGSASSCDTITDPTDCFTLGETDDTCDEDGIDLCNLDCQEQDGCACTVSGYLCDIVNGEVSCEGSIVCGGLTESCSSMDTQSNCLAHSGCEWIPLEDTTTATTTPTTKVPATANPAPTRSPVGGGISMTLPPRPSPTASSGSGGSGPIPLTFKPTLGTGTGTGSITGTAPTATDTETGTGATPTATGSATTDSSTSVYDPLDPWLEIQELVPPDGMDDDKFGQAVAIDGDTILVGAHYHKLGDDPDENRHGAAYVYTRQTKLSDDGSPIDVWSFAQKLTAGDAETGDWYGDSVALQGDIAVVGAFFADSDGHFGNGNVYVYNRNGEDGTWTQTQQLVSPNPDTVNQFGAHVALDGTTLVVGESSGEDASLVETGAVYVYVLEGGLWELQTQLLPENGVDDGDFGDSVDISGDTIVVGAPGGEEGTAVVFSRTGNVWDTGYLLKPDDGVEDDAFGRSVGIDVNTIVIATGQISPSKTAYIFEKSSGDAGDDVWLQTQKLESGFVAAISGDVLVLHRSLYSRLSNGTWVLQQDDELVTASDLWGSLTYSADISGQTVVVGSPNHGATDSGTVGIFGSMYRGSTAAQTGSEGVASDEGGANEDEEKEGVTEGGNETTVWCGVGSC